MKYLLNIVCVDGETCLTFEGDKQEVAEYLKIHDHEGSSISLTLYDPEEIYKLLGLVQECEVAAPFSSEYAGE